MGIARKIKQAGGVRGSRLQPAGKVIQGNPPYGPGSGLRAKKQLTGKHMLTKAMKPFGK